MAATPAASAAPTPCRCVCKGGEGGLLPARRQQPACRAAPARALESRAEQKPSALSPIPLAPQAVFDFVDVQSGVGGDIAPGSYHLATAYPRRILEASPGRAQCSAAVAWVLQSLAQHADAGASCCVCLQDALQAVAGYALLGFDLPPSAPACRTARGRRRWRMLASQPSRRRCFWS